ncbi:MAG: hypothetical protein CMI30_03880 [Opitutae bacterium]|nr:hypothetical protein [Opitutae bacterium]|tara:strand:- start:8244 stop:8843 length:600 start_codon:yes stop_codon:yes gene_type:complete
MKKLLGYILLAALPTLTAKAYETMYERTPVGTIEIKKIPRRTALEATSQNAYFEGGNNLFRTLFRYISSNDVAMTVPVEAEIKPGKMRFFVGSKDMKKKLPSGDGVAVKEMEPLTVLAIGIRGSYTEKRFNQNEEKLKAWLVENPGFEATSAPYGVYWNSPFVPGFFKRSEIHIEIRRKEKTIEDKERHSPTKPESNDS